MDDLIYSSLTPNMMVASVSHSIAFYRDLLGFDVIMSVPHAGEPVWARLQSGGAALMLQERNSLVDEYPDLAQRQTGSGLTLFVEVKGLDALYRRVQGRARIVKEPHVTFYGMREFAIEDPDGSILTLAERA